MAEKLDVYVSIHVNAFMTDWLVPVKYIFVDSQREKATELKKKLDAFKEKFDRHLIIDIRAEQGLIFASDIHRPSWLVCGLYQPP